jgi:hypothetical protein
MEKFLDRAGGNPQVKTEKNRTQPATNMKASSPVLENNLHGGGAETSTVSATREAKAGLN